MRPLGLLIMIASCAVPFGMFASLPNVTDKVALFSQYIGSVALILMALGMVMATRWPGVEAIFGGMDRTYVLHKWAGILSMVTILVHDTVDAEIDGLGRETALVELGETLGEISLYGLLILSVISVATFIPYHLWRWTHKAMGAFFVAGSLHYMLELKPFANTDPLGLYITAFCVIGSLAYAYTLLPDRLRAARGYTVGAIENTGGALALELAPAGRPLRHHAGQFTVATLADNAEPHPFTISSAPRADGSLRLSVKGLGDFTDTLPARITKGDMVYLQGPYGRFMRRVSKRPEVWIAAGIGITPFLAWAEALNDDTPIHLIYCIRTRADAPHLDAIEALAARHVNLTLHLVISSEGMRLTTGLVASLVGPALAEAKVAYCGPTELRKTLQTGLARHGITPRNFHYEAFEFRTGIGLGHLAKWIAAQAAAQARSKLPI